MDKKLVCVYAHTNVDLRLSFCLNQLLAVHPTYLTHSTAEYHVRPPGTPVPCVHTLARPDTWLQAAHLRVPVFDRLAMQAGTVHPRTAPVRLLTLL